MDGGKLRKSLALFALLIGLSVFAREEAAAAPSGGAAGGPVDLSGVYDLLINDFDDTYGYYHCIIAIDHNTSTNDVTTSSQCYADVDLSDSNAEPRNSLPGEGPDGLAGPKPPPPYASSAPSLGSGTFTPGSGGGLIATGCYEGLGGALGPNIIATLNLPLMADFLDAYGYAPGSVTIYRQQGSAACDALAPQGPLDDYWTATLFPISDINGAGSNHPAAWRTLGDTDFDNDGCSDADELAGAASCGDDPYNDLDLAPVATIVSGNYQLTATVTPADVCWNGTYGTLPVACSGGDGTLIPGEYQTCVLDVEQAGTSLTGRTYCYVDSPSIAVNPQVAGAKTCPPANTQYCGDGLVGASPPGRTVAPSGQVNFGDVDDKHTALTGQLSGGRILLSGCAEDRDGNGPLGHVYLALDVDAHTGQGGIVIAKNQTQANCLAGTPVGPPAAVGASLVREALMAQQRDTDGDGCPDQRELSDVKGQGGLRDPFNHYDYMNPSGDGVNRVDDILAVVGEYFDDDPPGNIDYDSGTDRTSILGANEWNLGPPNGQQRVDDILDIVKQYFHDC